MFSIRRIIVACVAFVLVFVIYSFPVFNQVSVVSGRSPLSFKPSILYVKDFAGTDFMKKKSLVTDTSVILKSSGNDQGTLIVTVKIVNKLAKLVPSDVRVTIHGNDPMPSSFRGNISGTPVRLHMGMYSVTAIGPSGYAPAYSGDCSGGMMSVHTKKCIITDRPA